MIERLFYTMLEISVSVTAVVLLVFLLTPLLKKRFTAKWRYWIWFALAIRLLFPFNFHVQQPAVQISMPQKTVAVQKAPAVSSARRPVGGIPIQPEQLSPEAVQPVTASQLLAAVWLAGAAIFLLSRFAAYFAFLRGIRRWSYPVGDADVLQTLRSQEAELGIRHTPVLLRCKKISSPMMAGFFRPILLLPEIAYSEEDLQLILKHELIHWKRRDVWYKLLLCAANAVHWFNPVVWLMAGRAGENTELVCDSEVVEGFDIDYREQYGKTILSSVRQGRMSGTVFSTYFSASAKILKQRFFNIFDGERKNKGIAAFCAVLAGIVVVGSLIACTGTDLKTQGLINNIALMDSGNSFAIKEGKLVITFGKDRTKITAPLLADKEYPSSPPSNGSIYISDEIVAIAYGGENGENVSALVTGDRGKTWKDCHVTNYDEQTSGQNFIGFTTKDDGWLVTMGDPMEGYAKSRIFQTKDGGKNWEKIGDANAVSPHVVTGAGFADSNTGFLSFFRYDTETDPVVFRTDNKGETWTKCRLSIPDSMKAFTAYATALSPVFCGASGVLPVNLIGIDGKIAAQIRYGTTDGGKTWAYQKTASPVSDSPSQTQNTSEASDANYPMTVCRDMNITNQILCGDYGTVVCGSLKNDPKQGVAVVIWGGKGAGKGSKRCLTPEKHGAIRAKVGDSAKEDVFSVSAEDGYTWTFSLFNGFEMGRQGR